MPRGYGHIAASLLDELGVSSFEDLPVPRTSVTTLERKTSGHITTIPVKEKPDGTAVCPDCGASFGVNQNTTHTCMA